MRKVNPFELPLHFTPRWRMERVLETLRNRPEPLPLTRADDYYVRVYQRVLRWMADANGDAKREAAVVRDYPAACQAHFIHYSSDIVQRQLIEAYLLTCLSAEGIAQRMAIEPAAIEHYEKIFFAVKDRLDGTVWITISIRSAFRREKEDYGAGAAQRGYVLRMFGYFGGPVVLEAIMRGIAFNGMPKSPHHLIEWFQQALSESVFVGAAAAALTPEFRKKDMLPLIRLAARLIKKTNKRKADRPDTSDEELGRRIAEAEKKYQMEI